MVVNVRNDQQCDRAFSLCLDCLPERVGVLGGDHTIERTCGVGFAGLVIKHEDNSSPHIKPLVVIASLVRGDDPKAGKCELALRHATAAKAMRVEVNTLKEFAGRRAAGRFETAGRICPRRDQIVAQEERSVVRHGSESKARKPGCNVLGCEVVLGGGGKAPAKSISPKEDQVRLQTILPDGIILRRMAFARGRKNAVHECELQGHAHGVVSVRDSRSWSRRWTTM